MNELNAFLARCRTYQDQHRRTQRWLSKELFNDTYKLESLSNGTCDIGVMKLHAALEKLTKMEVAAKALRAARAHA